MSKSLGNFLTIQEALKLYSPEAIRLFILSSHYRGPVDFGREAMLAAQRGVDRLHQTVRRLRARMKTAVPAGTAELSHIGHLMPLTTAFSEAMDDDFNTPQAIAALFDLNKEVNTLLSDSGDSLSLGTLSAVDELYKDLGGRILGIIPEDLTEQIGDELVNGLMEIILGLRQEFREQKDWDKSDELRRLLKEAGIAIEDRPDGAAWRVERDGG
jgi:cysteinyl-tRNA synthetase